MRITGAYVWSRYKRPCQTTSPFLSPLIYWSKDGWNESNVSAGWFGITYPHRSVGNKHTISWGQKFKCGFEWLKLKFWLYVVDLCLKLQITVMFLLLIISVNHILICVSVVTHSLIPSNSLKSKLSSLRSKKPLLSVKTRCLGSWPLWTMFASGMCSWSPHSAWRPSSTHASSCRGLNPQQLWSSLLWIWKTSRVEFQLWVKSKWHLWIPTWPFCNFLFLFELFEKPDMFFFWFLLFSQRCSSCSRSLCWLTWLLSGLSQPCQAARQINKKKDLIPQSFSLCSTVWLDEVFDGATNQSVCVCMCGGEGDLDILCVLGLRWDFWSQD